MSDQNKDAMEIKIPKKVAEELVQSMAKANGCGCGCVLGIIVKVDP